MAEQPEQRIVPPDTMFNVWTLEADDNSKRTHVGGSPDMQSAVMIACAVSSYFGVFVGVFDNTDAWVAYLGVPKESTP